MDVPSPIKRMAMMAGYREWIHGVEEAIETWFDLGSHPHNPVIKLADLTALATEKRDILGKCVHDAMWLETVLGGLPPPCTWNIKPLSPKQANRLFMRTWESIQ